MLAVLPEPPHRSPTRQLPAAADEDRGHISHGSGGNDDGGDGGHGDDGRDGQPIRWRTVAAFHHPTAAHLARIRLEAEGIPCFIADENTVTAAWHCAIALGGIKLQVPRDELPRASQLLSGGDAEINDAIVDGEADENLANCPRCGSPNLNLERWGGRRIIATTLLVLLGMSMHPLLGLIMLICAVCFAWTTRRQGCADCGYTWREPPGRGFDVVTDITPPER